MSTPVWKEVLCLGRHYDPKTDEWHEFKPAHVKRAHRNFQKMRERGVPLPAIWEHQKDIEAGTAPSTDEQIAEWKRRYARYTFAHTIDSRINERGNLDMLLDVTDPSDVAQLEKTKFVSPKVYNAGYWDTKGGVYDGTTIAHVAATPSPVQFWQKPFELSDSDALYLSFDAPEDEISKLHSENTPDSPGNPSIPHPPYDRDSKWSFDAWLDEVGSHCRAEMELSTTETPEPDMADDTEKKDGPPKKDEGGGGESKNADLESVIKAITDKFGVELSPKISNWNELVIALESQPGGEEIEPPAEEEASADPATESAPGGAPMMMSTLSKDKNKKARAEKYAKPERDEAKARINAAMKGDGKTGRDPRKARQLLARAEAVEMSFTDEFEATGKRWTKLLADIEAYEKSTPGVSLKPNGSVNLSTTDVAAPEIGKATMTTERRDQVVDAILGKRDVKTL